MIVNYRDKQPLIGNNSFIASSAMVIGDVKIEDRASIWYGVVVRGDMEPITIGTDTNIQDNCTIHTESGYPAVIGNRVSVGHNAVIHGCIIEDNCLIGIGALVLSGAHIRIGSVVAAGSVVKEGQEVGPYSLVAGTPAVVKKKLTKDEIIKFQGPVNNYLKLAVEHMNLKDNI